ncbi:hypothetical protein V6S21_08795 [Klebsiella pneumoniae]
MEHALVNYLSLDVPNTAFMLLCASLVMLMTPGLAFFYGGLVPRKSIVTIMAQSFFSMGVGRRPLVYRRLFTELWSDAQRDHRQSPLLFFHE